MRIEICNNSQRRMKSVAVLPITIISSPSSISSMKFISLFLIPISTIDWVRKGNISCRIQPILNPNAIEVV